MIKEGIYRTEATNQRTLCYQVRPPDSISIWFEEPNGQPQDHWWDQEITPEKFKQLTDHYNRGLIHAEYEYMKPQRKITSLLQLSHEDLITVFNYHAYKWPHDEWTRQRR